MSTPAVMKTVKTEVITIFTISSLRVGEWFLREPRLSEGSQSQEEKLRVPVMSDGGRYLRMPTVTSPGSPGEMSTIQHQAPEGLNHGGRSCGIKSSIFSILLSTTTLRGLVQKCSKMFGKFEYPDCAEERVIEFLTCAEECVIEFPTCEEERAIDVPSLKKSDSDRENSECPQVVPSSPSQGRDPGGTREELRWVGYI